MASIQFLRLSFHRPPPLLHRQPHHPIPSLPHPLKPHLPALYLARKRAPPSTITRMSYNPTPATDRLISSLSYFLPFFNGLQYGRHLFTQYPALASVFQPILPFFTLYKSIPYGSFVAFFGIYLAVVRNPRFSHYVRFNAMQAVVLDVLLVLPMLVQRIFSPGRAGLGFKIMIMGHDFMFVFVVFCFLYSLVSCLLGNASEGKDTVKHISRILACSSFKLQAEEYSWGGYI